MLALIACSTRSRPVAHFPPLPLQFIFSNMSSYHARVFGFAHIGKTIGVTVMLGGIVSLLQQALLLWAYVPPATDVGNFLHVNTLMLAMMVALALFPMWLTLRSSANKRWGGVGEEAAVSPPVVVAA